jgi:periplasmic divalent cation tolerance protein
MSDKLLVLTTAGSKAEARKIGEALVERRLAACVNIVPGIMSLYRWEGKVAEAAEYLLLIKTVEGREEQLRSAIREIHSYELPEFLTVSVKSGGKDYLKWLEESVG